MMTKLDIASGRRLPKSGRGEVAWQPIGLWTQPKKRVAAASLAPGFKSRPRPIPKYFDVLPRFGHKSSVFES
jgi:hypothetical protein